MTESPTLSVVIPAYNEEATIIEILEAVNRQKDKIGDVTLEVIVVDDGSKDRTAELVESRPDLVSQFIRQPQNGGKGAAVQAGLKAATGDFVLFQDADLEYSPDDYAAMLEPVAHLDAEVVMGSRMLAPRYTRVHYFWHKIGNRFITFFFNILNNTTFSDVYSCYLMYKRTLVDPDNLISFGWEQHAEILSKAVRSSKVWYEVPISYHGRSYEEGKKIRAHHTIGVVWMMLRMRLWG